MPNLQSDVLTQSSLEQCNVIIPREYDRLVPQALIWDGKCNNSLEFTNLCSETYKLLTLREIEVDGNPKQVLYIKFIENILPAQLLAIQNSAAVLAGLEPTLVGLYKLLMTIHNSATTVKTRAAIINIVASFNNQNINQVLERSCESESDDKTDPEYKYKLFISRYVPAVCLHSLEFLHKKARLAVEFYFEIQHLNKDIEKLKDDYQLMLTSLENRSNVNLLSHHVMMVKKLAMDKLSEYATLWDENFSKWVFCYLSDELQICREFKFDDSEADDDDDDNMAAWVRSKFVYNCVLHIPDIHPQSLTLFKNINKELEPIISGIRSFQPSPLEIASEKARYMKPSITRVRNDADEYLKPDSEQTTTIGKAKSLLEQIKSMRSVIDSLQMSGLLINQDTVGITPEDMEELYVKVSDALAQREYESKVSEAKARAANSELAKGAPQLQLPPLSGFSSWLNFRKAINDIMPLHSNSLIKRQILLKSLKNKEDFSRCQSMSYEDGFKYLVQRYESAALIPGLIDELLKLTPASSDRTAYENLTQLISTITMIQSYEQIEKLDSNARSKLTFILIHRELQLDFLKDQAIFEEGIKRDFCPNTEDIDALSEASCLQSQEVETKRRDWWLEQMSRYLGITRELIKTKESAKKTFQHNKGKSQSFQTQSQSFAASHQADHKCPLCNESHIDKGVVLLALSRCTRFKKMDVPQRISVVEANGHCKRCLRPKSDGQHVNGCSISKERNMSCAKCSPPSTTHHPLLHIDKQTQSSQQKPKQQGGSGGGRGGKGNSGSRGRGRSQPNSNRGTYSTQSNSSNNAANDNSNTDSVEVVTFKTMNTDIGIPGDASISITACSNVKLIIDQDTSVDLVALLDIGSTASYLTDDIVQQYSLNPCGKWQGNMVTLHGSRYEEAHIYRVVVADHNNHHHAVRVHGTPGIGMKRKIPDLFLSKLCSAFNLAKKAVQNPDGPIKLLLGLNCASFLASKVIDKHSVQFPGIFLWSTPLNSQFFFSGGLESRVEGSFRTLSYFVKDKQDKPCKSAPVCHKHCSTKDVKCKDFLSLPWKKWVSMVLLLLNLQLIPLDKTQIVFPLAEKQSYLSAIPHPSTNPCNVRLGIKDVSSFMKMSPALVSIEDSSGVSNLACKDCTQSMANCKKCQYINSSLSIRDLEELELLTKSISVIDTPEGKRILVTYPLREDALKYFTPQNSNREAARFNTIRLRERLKKQNLLSSYHEEMIKSLERGHISIFEDYTPDLNPQLFIFQNFVLKDNSSSQGCRPVSNSGTKNKSGHDLNQMTLTGPNYLCNGPAVFLAFRMHAVGYSMDVSRCYRSMYTDIQTSNLRLFYWYKDPEKPETLCIFRYDRVTYGDRPAGCLLEISFRTIVAPACKLEISKSTICNERIVDDIASSQPSKLEVDNIVTDLSSAFDSFGFGIKHVFKTHDDIDPQGVLGMLWAPRSDELSVTTVLNIHVKKRGRYAGLALTPENINTAVLDKVIIARLSGQCFAYLNCLIGPIQACIRILFSQACRVLKDWVSPLHLADKELDTQAKALMMNLVNLPERIRPMPRCIIPYNYELKRICISSDSGKDALACTVHFVSANTANETYSTLCYTKCKVHQYSTPDGEFCAMVVGVKTLAEILSFDCISRLVKDKPVQVLMVSDSLCTANSLSPTKIHKETRPRNYSHIVYRQSTELCHKFPHLSILYTHVRSSKNSSDYLTKLVPDPTLLSNLDLYRYGPEEFQSPSWPEAQKVFLRFSHGQEPIYQKAVAEQDDEGQCMHCNSTDYCLNFAATEVAPVPVPPYSHVGILDRDQYTRLLDNCRSLMKAINVVRLIISIFSVSFSKLQPQDQLNISFFVIAKSHQTYFKAQKTKQARPAYDCYQIARISTRLSPEDGLALGVHHAPILISHHDKRLVWLLINHAHLAKTGVKSPIHLGPVFTLSRLRSGHYPVHITRSRQYVEMHISKCVTCRFAHARPATAQLGSPRFIRHLHNNNIVFAICSMDPIGPWTHKTHRGSRTSTKFYLLLLSCLVTKTCNIVIMEGLKREEVIVAFRQHCNQYRTPAELYVDKGTSINPLPGSDLWNRYFNGETCTVHQLEAGHQQNNFVERSVSVVKRLLRTSFLQREKLHFPDMTFCELSSLLSTVIHLLNSRPVFSTTSGSQVITPNHLTKTHLFHQADEDTDSALQNLQLNFQNFYSQLKITHSIFVKIVKDAFRSNLGTTQYLGNGQEAIFLPGDFCLIFRTDKLAVGIVQDPGPQYCTVRTAETNPPALATVHNNKLLLLFREPHQESSVDNQNLIDRRDGADVKNVKSSCFIQSFLVVPSNKIMKQSFHPQVLPNPVQPPKISSNYTPTNNWVTWWPFPQSHGCGKW